MEWLQFAEDNEFIITTNEMYKDIPYICVTPKGYKDNIPTVIYYHGWMSSKEFLRFQAMMIASFGYQVILPDALHHGQRDCIDHTATGASDKYLWKIMINTVEESTDFIEHLVNEHGVDRDRLCVSGNSMGGITAGGVFSQNPNIKLLGCFNGILNWTNGVASKGLPSCDGFEDKLKKYDLSNNMDSLDDRKILMIHGVGDTAVPIGLQRDFLREYKDKDIELIEFSNVDHRITTSMIGNFITWLRANL